jgi:hypothetical protein
MSSFSGYGNRREHKTLREYSMPSDLRRVDPQVWVSGEHAWHVAEALDDVRHFKLMNGRQLREVTRRDPLERRAASLRQFPVPRVLVARERARLQKRRMK